MHRVITRLFRARYQPWLGHGSTALLCADRPPTRAVVMVHGFGGRATATWHDLSTYITGRDWWSESDVFFFGYNSILESVPGTADRLAGFLTALLPDPPDLLPRLGPSAAARRGGEYTELVLAAHSQGGLVTRMAVLQVLWDVLGGRRDPDQRERLVAGCTLRLFAPAIFGSRPAGLLGLAVKAAGLRGLFEALSGASPSYQEMKPKYGLVNEVQRRTETLAERNPDVNALTASILWPANDLVVLDGGQYLCDPACSRLDGGNHRSVCKAPPQGTLEFIRRGIPYG